MSLKKNTLLFFILIHIFGSPLKSQDLENAAALKAKAYDMYMEDKEITTSLNLMNQSISINPFDAGAYFVRGSIHLTRNEYPEAIKDFTKNINLDPNSDSYTSYFYRGEAKRGLSDEYGAINDYKVCLKDTALIYLRYQAYRALCILLTNSENSNELRKYGKNMFEDKYLDQTSKNEGYCYYANSFFISKDYVSAIKYYTISIDRFKRYDTNVFEDINFSGFRINCYLNRGMCLLKTGKKSLACLDFSKAGELGGKEAYQFIKEYCQ